MYTVSITSQGQISIPVSLRRQLRFDEYPKAHVYERRGKIVIKPILDFFELKGSLKTKKKPLTSREIHERFAEYLAHKATGKHE